MRSGHLINPIFIFFPLPPVHDLPLPPLNVQAWLQTITSLAASMTYTHALAKWKEGVPKPWDTSLWRVRGHRWWASLCMGAVVSMASTAVSASGRPSSYAWAGQQSSSRRGWIDPAPLPPEKWPRTNTHRPWLQIVVSLRGRHLDSKVININSSLHEVRFDISIYIYCLCLVSFTKSCVFRKKLWKIAVLFWIVLREGQLGLEIKIWDYSWTRFDATNPIAVLESWNELPLEFKYSTFYRFR